MCIIKVENLEKKYKDRDALKGISFEVKRGEIFGFLGPNGAGKTTTIKILTTQIKPDRGQVLILDKDPIREPDYIKESIGVVFEDQNLYKRLTVEQNLMLFARLYGKGKERVAEVMDFVRISDRKKEEVQKLSRGLKQRVVIARALLPDPQIIFLDEPTVGLDPHIAREIRFIFKELKKKGKTLFLTTHYMEEADEMCDRIAIINKGEIVRIGTPESLKDSLGKPRLFITVYNGKKEKRGEGKGVYGEIAEVRECPPEDASTLDFIKELNQNSIPYKIHTKNISLEDVFITLTGEKLE